MPHQSEWDENAKNVIILLKKLLKDIAIDIQHIGSTAIFSICAKPIIDIVVGVQNVDSIMTYVELLKQYHILFHGEVISGQKFFVIENKEMRSHHIHIVKWNGTDWNNYLDFRDYLNANLQKAIIYNDLKQKLAKQFSKDRKSYTSNKQKMIQQLLEEARVWKEKLR